MKYEGFTCMDAGTDYCPCHLAETGDCIICSMLQGKNECNCTNWCSTCIYNDYISNGEKVKEKRQYYEGQILEKEYVTDNVIILKIATSYSLIKELALPGSFIFLKHSKSDSYYEIPLSVMNISLTKNMLELAIEVKGPKTNKINELGQNEDILLRGPYWNGIMGIKYINNLTHSNVITIAKGIHQAPLVSVIKNLNSNNNNIYSFLDTGRIKKIFIGDYLNKYTEKYFETNFLTKDMLSIEFKNMLLDYIDKIKPSLIFCAGSDLINNNILQLIRNTSFDIKFACTNNSKMSCGEGICGCCTLMNNDFKLRRMCKMQTDPEFILQGRLIY